jgi:hypothetical protein
MTGIAYKFNDIDMIAYHGDDDYQLVLKMQQRGEKMEIKTKDALDLAIEKAKEDINSFPMPNKPSTFGKPYDFPEDVVHTSLVDLGQWLFKMAGYKGYALRMLARAEIEESMLKDIYSAKISKEMAKIEAQKKMNKESMIGMILNEHEDIKVLRNRLMNVTNSIIKGKRAVEIYSMQLDVISREISRRNLDMKLMPRGTSIE